MHGAGAPRPRVRAGIPRFLVGLSIDSKYPIIKPYGKTGIVSAQKDSNYSYSYVKYTINKYYEKYIKIVQQLCRQTGRLHWR
eukprot:SAG31_NODE_1925_length_6893_cov_3.984987_4_plen_82_part_00